MKDRSRSLASLFLASAAFVFGVSLLSSTAEAGVSVGRPRGATDPCAARCPVGTRRRDAHFAANGPW